MAQLGEVIAGSDALPKTKRAELRGRISTMPGLAATLPTTPGGRLRVDRAAIRRETHLDGKWLLRCSDPSLSAQDIAAGYKQLLERSWRDMTTHLDLRQVHHRKEEHIRAHVLLCWPGLLLIRIAKNTLSDRTWRRIREELETLQSGTSPATPERSTNAPNSPTPNARSTAPSNSTNRPGSCTSPPSPARQTPPAAVGATRSRSRPHHRWSPAPSCLPRSLSRGAQVYGCLCTTTTITNADHRSGHVLQLLRRRADRHEGHVHDPVARERYMEGDALMPRRIAGAVVLMVVAALLSACAPLSAVAPESYFSRWGNAGPLAEPGFFPIGVWLQDPRRTYNGTTTAVQYRDMGANLIVGSYEPWSAVHDAAVPDGMWVLADSSVTPTAKASSKVVGYVSVDEPDMALHDGQCIPPNRLRQLVNQIRYRDQTRPVFVNFGKGFALPDFAHGSNCPIPTGRDAWRANGHHDPDDAYPDDYIDTYHDTSQDGIYYQWAAAPDIVSVDHYSTTDTYEPALNRSPEGYGRMVRRAREFAERSNSDKPVWAVIQTTNIGYGFTGQPTPAEVRNFVRLAMEGGADGIIYFAHCFEPVFYEDCLLRNPAMVEELKRINVDIADGVYNGS